jgi:acetyl esterase/lipase
VPVTHHPDNPRDRAASLMLRNLVLRTKGTAAGPLNRAIFDDLMAQVPDAPGVTYEAAHVGDVPGWWCRVSDAGADTAMLYLHGGAYVVGSAAAYRHFAGQIAARAGVDAFVPDYALAPEHPFPAAVQSAQAVYDGLAAMGITRIILAGDSAGGGLALVLLRRASERARSGATRRPVAAAVISAWTDLALTGESLNTCDAADPLLSRSGIVPSARMYLGDGDPRDPDASPLYGDLADLPPVLMHVGSAEVLLDDTVRYGVATEGAGSVCDVHIWEGMIHVFPSYVSLFSAAREALDDIGEFVRRQTQVARDIPDVAARTT